MSERMQKRELYGAVAGVALLAFAMAWRWLFPWLERIDWSRPAPPVVEAVPERVKELAAQAQQPAPDVIDDEPRFRTLADFFGTLLLDSARILNSGGHVRYGPDDQEVFPIRYEFD